MLSKAQLIISPSNGDDPTIIPLHFNPSKIDVSRGLKIERAANTGSTKQESRIASVEPIKFKLDSLIFDTYQLRKSVRKLVIDKLEAAIITGAEKASTYSVVRFNWGQFTDSDHDGDYKFLVRGFDCSYQLFLPDGTPVRAVVNLRLEEFEDKNAAKSKAKAVDDAQLHQVRKGENAQSIAAKLYKDAGAWRAICKANKIADPMCIPPGTQLIIPPAPKNRHRRAMA